MSAMCTPSLQAQYTNNYAVALICYMLNAGLKYSGGRLCWQAQ